MTRRKFLEVAVAGIAASSFMHRADAASGEDQETQKERVFGAALDKRFRAFFPWLPECGFPEYRAMERVEGRAHIVDRLVAEITSKRRPEAVVFGEVHTRADFKEIFWDVVERDPAIAVIAEEAIAHRSAVKQYDRGILSLRTFTPDDEDHLLDTEEGRGFLARIAGMHHDPEYQDTELLQRNTEQERRARSIVQTRGISYSLLHRLAAPSAELESKVLGLLGGRERAAIYTGSAHAMVIPGGEAGAQVTFLEAVQKRKRSVFGVQGIDRSIQERSFVIRILLEALRALKEEGVPLIAIQKALEEKSRRYQTLLDTAVNSEKDPALLLPKTGDIAVLLAGAHRTEEQASSSVEGVSAMFSQAEIASFLAKAAPYRITAHEMSCINLTNGEGLAVNHATKDGQVLLNITWIRGKKSDTEIYTAKRGENLHWVYEKK